MSKLNFEKNLDHQLKAVSAVLAQFQEDEIKKTNDMYSNLMNPLIKLNQNQSPNQILDIMMETGTGKTYTYTKTIFELNQHYGIFKFIVVVPTLSIKAGTISFLKSESCCDHFKEQYQKTLSLHIVESQKINKNKKLMPIEIRDFVNANSFDQTKIQVLIINAGMINSELMQKSLDQALFDQYHIPFEAIASTQPIMIIDEPHKFNLINKTWENLQKMKPQIILRYGATFPSYQNLVYQLTAIDAFNQNLVKGIVAHVTEFQHANQSIIELLKTDGTEATFKITENGKSTLKKLVKTESLISIHPEMHHLTIENLNKSLVVLSNGLSLKVGDQINPFSYAEKLKNLMIQRAIQNHFELEQQLLTRKIKIKPLTLFFIDQIDEYRNQEGEIRKVVEQQIALEVDALLETQNDPFYLAYLKKTKTNLSATHAGYFSKDNSDKDENIEKEINEILHDKQALLDLANPRRFIFSKWTLREGWDNPNVFQICKLRSSGSEISKLQEVGRGLRLPVNEYGNRVKDESFDLHYFVDFTENDFVEKLISEINEKSGIDPHQIPTKLDENMVKKICEIYRIIDENQLLIELESQKIINRSNLFLTGGFDLLKEKFPLIFKHIQKNKIRSTNSSIPKMNIRKEKYKIIQHFWETLCQKVILEYQFENEITFKSMFKDFLKKQKEQLLASNIHERIAIIDIKDQKAIEDQSQSLQLRNLQNLSTMKYSTFLKELSKQLHVNLKTLHQSLIEENLQINHALNQATIRRMKSNFEHYLMSKATESFKISYHKVSSQIHPTKFTDSQGEVLSEIPISDFGLFHHFTESVSPKYLLNTLCYDSPLEKENIQKNDDEILVFTKIPKNSIKIPIAGGKTYSPDFAYILKLKTGEQHLHFIIETKDVHHQGILREEERSKIKHAEIFGKNIEIQFKTQFSNDHILDLLKSMPIPPH